ncbi:MAG: hypothetical protein QHC65_04280 [Sphingomonas sp.]|nr:hypothetical protein [Sphingomonas sp.]MDX3883616.1 hypothetical protein [Sphingomonas sp.]
MQIDKESHREILKTAVENLPISGPAGHPEMLTKVLLIHEVLVAIERAGLGGAAQAAIPGYEPDGCLG